MGTELRVLGQVELRVDGRLVEVGHARQRCVLAVLVVEANRVVTMEQLLDRVWADRLPHKARQTVSNYVSRLRQTLVGHVAVVRRGGGYVLEVDPAAVDLHQFRRLVQQARGREDAQALALLEKAAGMWRGEAFAGLDTPWLAAARTSLERERIAARLDRVDVALRCGRHAEVLPELFVLANQDDGDERVAAQLMLALYRAGRTVDALAHYRRVRARLVEQLGTDPRHELQSLHQRILEGDPTLLSPPATNNRVSAGTATPRQLPAPPRWFTGRGIELARLDEALITEPNDDLSVPGSVPGQQTVMILAIGGAGGIGKTWLALAWAYRHQHRFPDGQLFVDLHGFSPSERPRTPESSLPEFLGVLGVESSRMPAHLDAQAALYRSLVAGKRMLIVLDNAATADQVVPLLPGSPTCTVLVTGRARLASLMDRHGAHHLQLDTLTRDEALDLMAARLSADRPAADLDPADLEAVNDLVDLCGCYPLALSITARNAASRPGVPLAEVTTELREAGLDMLDHATDVAASLPAVLSWSTRRLSQEQRLVFGLMGIAPGPDISLPAAAALGGVSSARARSSLSALGEASLIEHRPGGRYSMHDLVRAYATTAQDLCGDVREAALARVADFYLHTARSADNLLDPTRPFVELAPPAPGAHPHSLADPAAALEWLETEYVNLLATQRAAAASGRHHLVWHLAWALDTFQLRRGHLRDRLASWRVALDAAAHLSDPATHIRTYRLLGYACSRLSLHEEAVEQLHQALDLAVRHHDAAEQAHTHQVLAHAWELRGDDRRALDHARRGLALYRALDQPARVTDVLNLVGWYAARLGDFDTARDHCRAALRLHRQHRHDPDGEAATLDSLGLIAHRTGDHRQAVEHYQESVTLFRTVGSTYELADTLDSVGHPHAALGQHDQARKVWQEALDLYEEQDRSEDVVRVQRQLDDVPPAAEPG